MISDKTFLLANINTSAIEIQSKCHHIPLTQLFIKHHVKFMDDIIYHGKYFNIPS